jgi:hypothetical protein
MVVVNKKQQKTLQEIYERPTRADIRWRDVESLFSALGADIEEGNGSRVCVALRGTRAVFHRPHPGRIAGRLMIDGVRDFLMRAGVKH